MPITVFRSFKTGLPMSLYQLGLYEYISLVVYYFAFLMHHQDIFIEQGREQAVFQGAAARKFVYKPTFESFNTVLLIALDFQGIIRTV
jgi:hypothetical protein